MTFLAASLVWSKYPVNFLLKDKYVYLVDDDYLSILFYLLLRTAYYSNISSFYAEHTLLSI